MGPSFDNSRVREKKRGDQLVVLRYGEDKSLTAAAREMRVGLLWTSRVHARTLRMLGEGIVEKAFDLLRELGFLCIGGELQWVVIDRAGVLGAVLSSPRAAL